MLSYIDYSQSASRVSYSRSRRRIHYDKIVDRSNFRPDADDVRTKSLRAGSSSPGDIGLYDYKDGKVNKHFTPSAIQIALRQGQLDKADIQKLREVLTDDFNKSSKEYNEAKQLDDAQKAATASQERLNDILANVSAKD